MEIINKEVLYHPPPKREYSLIQQFGFLIIPQHYSSDMRRHSNHPCWVSCTKILQLKLKIISSFICSSCLSPLSYSNSYFRISLKGSNNDRNNIKTLNVITYIFYQIAIVPALTRDEIQLSVQVNQSKIREYSLYSEGLLPNPHWV